jgi:hypothetical protein
MRRILVCLAILSVIGLGSCSKMGSKEAVKEAIQKHLHENSHLMLNSFTTQFEKIDVTGDTAEALVRYQSKKLPQLAVLVRYGLKKVDGKWQVISSSSAGGQMTNPANPHEGMGTETETETGTGAAPSGAPPGPIASH